MAVIERHGVLMTEEASDVLDEYRRQRFRENALCVDCRINIFASGNYAYMVHNEIWAEAGLRSGSLSSLDPSVHVFACVRCLERRLGRKLKRSDLTCAPINAVDPADAPPLRRVKRSRG